MALAYFLHFVSIPLYLYPRHRLLIILVPKCITREPYSTNNQIIQHLFIPQLPLQVNLRHLVLIKRSVELLWGKVAFVVSVILPL